MGIIIREDDTYCRFCTRQMLQTENFYGERMWVEEDFVCRHERCYVCPECRIDRKLYAECSKCGCQEVYC